MSPATLWRSLCLLGYLGVFITLVSWYTVLAPPTMLPIPFVLVTLVAPLLFPLRGMIQGRRYTYSWSLFLSMFYFTHGVIEAYSNANTDIQIYALIEITFCLLWFIAGIKYVRTH